MFQEATKLEDPLPPPQPPSPITNDPVSTSFSIEQYSTKEGTERKKNNNLENKSEHF